MITGYYLGCPAWAVKAWVGRLFPPGTPATEFLAHYATIFNAVEGNTTFYALPTEDQISRWVEQTPPTFRFCFKFPREISHDKLLVDAAPELAVFLARIAPLEGRLGATMLQLPARFEPAQLPNLRAFLDDLPKHLRYAVEVRHEAFFHAGPARSALIDLLAARGIDLVMLDTRGLHLSHSLEHLDVRARKPQLPVIARSTAQHPLVRLVPHEDFAEPRSLGFASQWVAQTARWLADGKTPYVFVHAPDDTFAPENAYAFHAMLREKGASVGDLPPWTGSRERQLSLL